MELYEGIGSIQKYVQVAAALVMTTMRDIFAAYCVEPTPIMNQSIYHEIFVPSHDASTLTVKEKRDSLPLKVTRSWALLEAWRYRLFDARRPSTYDIPSDETLVTWMMCSSVSLWIRKHHVHDQYEINLACPCQKGGSNRAINTNKHVNITRICFTKHAIRRIESSCMIYDPSSPDWPFAKLHAMVSIRHFGAFHAHNYVHFHGVAAFACAIAELNHTEHVSSNAYRFLEPYAKYTNVTNMNGLNVGEGIRQVFPLEVLSLSLVSVQYFRQMMFYRTKQAFSRPTKGGVYFNDDASVSICKDDGIPYIKFLRETHRCTRRYIRNILTTMTDEDEKILNQIKESFMDKVKPKHSISFIDLLSTYCWLSSVHHTADHYSFNVFLDKRQIPWYSTSQSIDTRLGEMFDLECHVSQKSAHDVFYSTSELLIAHSMLHVQNYSLRAFADGYVNELQACVRELKSESKSTIIDLPLYFSVCI